MTYSGCSLHYITIRSSTDKGVDTLDVFNPGHMPQSESPDYVLGRRIARARHKNGCNNLWLDWHVDWMNAEKKMTIEMWRWKK